MVGPPSFNPSPVGVELLLEERGFILQIDKNTGVFAKYDLTNISVHVLSSWSLAEITKEM